MLAVAVFICWLVAELFVTIKVAGAIGVPYTILLLIAGWPIGIWVLRSQGRTAWRRLGAAVAEGRPPAREVVDGALALLGGGLLIVPGFITDLIGACLLFGPVRALMRRLLVRNFNGRLVTRAARFTRSPPGYDVDSTANDIDPPRIRP